ncbi:MAG TPA: alpha/beta hydrolase [Acidimicrobiia bacterium]|jgi:pimeloyl-ACP methyl ester carboxylesterase
MATYALVHGASSDSWYWHLVAPELRRRGHDVVAPDLPSDDDRCGFEEYAAAVVDAIGGRPDVVLVAQSLGGFTAPLVGERVPVRLLVLVAAMVPMPGEAPGAWWADTGWEQARRDAQRARGDAAEGIDPLVDFFHDVPPDVVAAAMARGERRQSGTPFERPSPLAAWPDIPTRFLLCTEDRFLPAAFQRRVVRDRLGIVPDELASGHLPALAHPLELVEALERYRVEAGLPPT